jgi:hypothetical protein
MDISLPFKTKHSTEDPHAICQCGARAQLQVLESYTELARDPRREDPAMTLGYGAFEAKQRGSAVADRIGNDR